MKKMALTKDGRLSYCSAPEGSRGIGRCNHLEHQGSDESPEEFVNRLNGSGLYQNLIDNNYKASIMAEIGTFDGYDDPNEEFFYLDDSFSIKIKAPYRDLVENPNEVEFVLNSRCGHGGDANVGIKEESIDECFAVARAAMAMGLTPDDFSIEGDFRTYKWENQILSIDDSVNIGGEPYYGDEEDDSDESDM